MPIIYAREWVESVMMGVSIDRGDVLVVRCEVSLLFPGCDSGWLSTSLGAS